MTDLIEKFATPLLRIAPEISLWEAVKTTNWQAIALNYNRPDYKTYGYDTKLQAAYARHRSRAR